MGDGKRDDVNMEHNVGYQIKVKKLVVSFTDTTAHPNTMMVSFFIAFVAFFTMRGSQGLVHLANFTVD